jgi:hypothetical protein
MVAARQEGFPANAGGTERRVATRLNEEPAMKTRHKALLTAKVVAVLAGATVFAATLNQGTIVDPLRQAAVSPPPRFEATVHSVTAADLGASWHSGCPVGPDQLQLVELTHIGMDGNTHTGQLIVNRDRVQQVIALFDQLYRMRFPIEKIRTVDHYPHADDELSMEDNNTSAFNCRDIPRTGRWSQHAFGRAIDINPLLNPYVDKNDTIQPKNGAKYLDRTLQDPGLLHDNDPSVRVFTDRGWTWGGHWTNPVDYQHFELP